MVPTRQPLQSAAEQATILRKQAYTAWHAASNELLRVFMHPTAGLLAQAQRAEREAHAALQSAEQAEKAAYDRLTRRNVPCPSLQMLQLRQGVL